MKKTDVIIIGAGAAGLMCAIEAGKRNRKVVVLEKSNKPGKKILMSGGGRCNFTNINIHPDAYISHNPHFCKSALRRYTAEQFIDLVKKYDIPFYEKTLGQLFCENKSSDILGMLLKECQQNNVETILKVEIVDIEKRHDNLFKLVTSIGDYLCESLVIASGGLSIPTMGASPFGYKIAEQFGIPVWPTRAGLVPLTLDSLDKLKYETLSGISVGSIVKNNRTQFQDNILFTHRGLSGPAILQISSYWMLGEVITINLYPKQDIFLLLKGEKKSGSARKIKSILGEYLPKRLVEIFIAPEMIESSIANVPDAQLKALAKSLHAWMIKPNGTEGYRTAEVTLGGVDCNAISSQTMEALHIKGLYFVGEVLDVTGWLGGYNFQWAWSSGWVAGQTA